MVKKILTPSVVCTELGASLLEKSTMAITEGRRLGKVAVTDGLGYPLLM